MSLNVSTLFGGEKKTHPTIQMKSYIWVAESYNRKESYTAAINSLDKFLIASQADVAFSTSLAIF